MKIQPWIHQLHTIEASFSSSWESISWYCYIFKSWHNTHLFIMHSSVFTPSDATRHWCVSVILKFLFHPALHYVKAFIWASYRSFHFCLLYVCKSWRFSVTLASVTLRTVQRLGHNTQNPDVLGDSSALIFSNMLSLVCADNKENENMFRSTYLTLYLRTFTPQGFPLLCRCCTSTFMSSVFPKQILHNDQPQTINQAWQLSSPANPVHNLTIWVPHFLSLEIQRVCFGLLESSDIVAKHSSSMVVLWTCLGLIGMPTKCTCIKGLVETRHPYSNYYDCAMCAMCPPRRSQRVF